MSTVVITGISRGIGKAAAEEFLNKGWQVIGGSQSGSKPFEHSKFFYRKLDVTNHDDVIKFKEYVQKVGKEINVLVNSAGILLDKEEQFSMEFYQKTMDVNVKGLIDVSETLLPNMVNGGHIINLSSGLGSIEGTINGFYPTYRISKAAVNMYTRLLAGRLLESGITVSSIDPGWVKTDMGGFNASRNPPEPAAEIYSLATSRVETGNFWYKGKKKPW